ncbi:MAG: FkbM family methyltransferase [bacterium]
MPAVLSGRDHFFRRTAVKHGHVERFGSAYGGWNVNTDRVESSSVVYSFGVGDDASFDLSLIERYGCRVHAFDPTPKALEWVQAQHFVDKFVLHEFGLADVDGDLAFNPPEDSAHVSYTILDRPATCGRAIRYSVKRLKTIMELLGHAHIDILKMDIEGAEYGVITDMANCNICPNQILIEFHHRFPGVGIIRTKAAVAQIKKMGYKLFAVSSTGEEFGFVRSEE